MSAVASRLTVLAQVSFGIGIVAGYVLLILIVKSYFYVGWTFKGFATDWKALLSISMLLLAPATALWTIYRRENLDASLVALLRRVLTSDKLVVAVRIEVLIVVVLSALLIMRPTSISEELDYHVANENWDYAVRTLEQLRRLPIDPDILATYEHYIDAHSRVDGNRLEKGAFHRQQLSAVRRMIDTRRGDVAINMLTYGELARILFFVEDQPHGELHEATSLLEAFARSPEAPSRLGLIYGKLGDLYILTGDLAAATERYNLALAHLEESSPAAAAVLADLGIVAVEKGDIRGAIELYRQAEPAYPQGRRAIFYSNLGYLLMLNEDYEAAETAIRRALAINEADWYSYLNLALVFDAQRQFEDALLNYDILIKNGGGADYVREAHILKAYTLHRSGRPTVEVIAPILIALRRSSDSAPQIAISPAAVADLYANASRLLRDTNTRGIARYIDYFDKLARL